MRLLLMVLAGAALSTGASAGSAARVGSFHAVAVNMSNVGAGGAGTLDIEVERWTTDAELAALRDAMRENGSGTLLSALHRLKPRVGYVRHSSGGLGWDLYFARKEVLADGSYKVIIASDRPMSYRERTNGFRSAEYEFLFAEMRIGKDGSGQGSLVPMARLYFDGENDVLEVEGYASEPVRLTRVTENR